MTFGRRPRHREEPARLGALRIVEHAADADASGGTAVASPLRRGRRVLGARRDRARGRRASSTPTRPTRPSELPEAVAAALPGSTPPGWSRGCGRWSASRRTTTHARGDLPRVASLPRGARRATADGPSSSRTCTGPATTSSTSSTSSPDWVTDVPLLIVATARPELVDRRPGWGGGKRNAHTVSLAPLDEDRDGAAPGFSLLDRAPAAGGDTAGVARPRGRQPAVCRAVRAHARGAGRGQRHAARDGAGDHHRTPGLAAAAGEGSACSTPQSSAGRSGAVRSTARTLTSTCWRCSGRSSSGANVAARSPARASMSSLIC